MSLQNKYKRTPKELPQKKGSSEVVSQIVSSSKENDKQQIKKKKATFLLDETLHKELRVFAAMNDFSMLEVVEKALEIHLKK